MTALKKLVRLWRSFFQRHHLEAGLEEELQSTFEMLVDRLIARGMSAEEARRVARIEFQGIEQMKESVRDEWLGSHVHAFAQDFRYALRTLRRQYAFASVVLVTLALGIGLNTAVFGVFYSVLVRHLPYSDPGRLVLVWSNFRTRGTANVAASGAIFREIQSRQRSMADIAGIWVTPPRTIPGDPPEQVKSAFVTTNFFDVLGVRAGGGRTFIQDDGARNAVVLADSFFQRRVGPRTDWSSTVKVANVDVLGVLPKDFQLYFTPEANVPGDVQVFQPWGPDFTENKNYIIRIVARLNAGVTEHAAQQDFDRVAEEIRRGYGEFAREDLHFTIKGMQADAFHDVEPALIALFAGGAFVLLISCVNVTSLLLARASDRRREIALKLALGASRNRIVIQLGAEAVLLGVVGGVAGSGIGWAMFHALASIRPDRLARIDEGGVVLALIVFAALCSIAAVFVFTLIPALQSSRMDCAETLRTKGRGWLGRLNRWTGRTLVITEIALAFVLVAGAVLTSRTFSNIEHVRPGFEPTQLLVFQLPGLSPSALNEWEGRFAALPGVRAAGAVSHLPFDTTVGNWYGEYRVRIGDRVVSYTADSRAVTRGYLPAMGIRLKEGRYFGPQDHTGGPNVVIVDELLARSTWPGESAVGKIIDAEHMTPNGTPFELVPSVVVGVVEHVRNHSLTHEVRPEIYSPFDQNRRDGFPQTFVLRTDVPPVALVPTVRAALREQNRNLSIDKVRAMTDYVEKELSPAGFTAVLAAIFGVLALLLAMTGIYGVLNYQVARAMPEMGIRMALGATARNVLTYVLRDALGMALTGTLLGCIGAFAVAHGLRSLLYGIQPADPISYGIAAFLLIAAALLGCWAPAWRAASANPVDTIREE